MRINHQLRLDLIPLADEAFFGLMKQVDHLLDVIGFYLDRYPCVTHGDLIRTKEINTTVEHLARLPILLSEVIRRWKSAEERALSRMGTEVCILNELWSNIIAMIMFISNQGMSLDPFDQDTAERHLATLKRCNQLLT